MHTTSKNLWTIDVIHGNWTKAIIFLKKEDCRKSNSGGMDYEDG